MNVLFLTHRLPYAPNRGDRIRAYHMLEEMSRFAAVSLFSLVHDDAEASRAASVPFVRRVATSRVPRTTNLLRGASGLFSARPLTHALLDAPDVREQLAQLVAANPPDVVLSYCSGMARFALESPLDGFPFVLDLVDVDSRKWMTLSRRTTPVLRWIYRREARTLAAFEALAASHSKAVLVVNTREQEALASVAPRARVRVVQNGVDVSTFAPPGPPSADPIVVFCGVMNYGPNADGVAWFVEHVWPHVRARRPDARFLVVGADPPSRLTSLAARDNSIEVTGRVDAVPPHLWRAAVAVAPLRLAMGLQNKVLEALAAGLPAVVTPAVAAGLPRGVERGCLVADEPRAFADAVTRLLKLTPEARRAQAALAGVDTLAWSAQLAPLQRILEEAAS